MPIKGKLMRSKTLTKGLCAIEESLMGKKTEMTNTEPKKKKTIRHKVALIALGITSLAFLVSPTATPMTSVPVKAKITASIAEKTAALPLGKNPPIAKMEVIKNRTKPMQVDLIDDPNYANAYKSDHR